MKLWLLLPADDLVEPEAYREPKHNPWNPWYDKAFGFVVRAETEEQARQLADGEGGDENGEGRPWLDPSLSTCTELVPDGPAGVILQDYHAA